MESRVPAQSEVRRGLLLFLGCSALLNPALSVVAMLAYPDEYDPFWARLLLGLISGAGVALVMSRWKPTWHRPAALLIALGMQGWYLHLGQINGMSFARVLNACLLVVVTAVVFERRSEIVIFILATCGLLAWGYTGPQTDDMPLIAAEATVLVMGAAVWVVVDLRTQLKERMAVQSANSEALVVEVERRKEAEQVALRASRSKSAFLANMSHELRTPLNAIMGYTELVQEGAEEETQRDLGRVLLAAQHLLGLIDEVLDLSRIEAGRLELSIEAVDLSELIGRCLEVIRPAAEAKQLDLTASLPKGLTLYTDRMRTKQIVLNLLSNAVKFTQAGSVQIEVSRTDSVRISVHDTGIGIDPASLPRLFNAFERAPNVQNPSGTGLGLAIGRELAQRMGGSLSATSTPGRGSTFVLRLPTGPPG